MRGTGNLQLLATNSERSLWERATNNRVYRVVVFVNYVINTLRHYTIRHMSEPTSCVTETNGDDSCIALWFCRIVERLQGPRALCRQRVSTVHQSVAAKTASVRFAVLLADNSRKRPWKMDQHNDFIVRQRGSKKFGFFTKARCLGAFYFITTDSYLHCKFRRDSPKDKKNFWLAWSQLSRQSHEH